MGGIGLRHFGKPRAERLGRSYSRRSRRHRASPPDGPPGRRQRPQGRRRAQCGRRSALRRGFPARTLRAKIKSLRMVRTCRAISACSAGRKSAAALVEIALDRRPCGRPPEYRAMTASADGRCGRARAPCRARQPSRPPCAECGRSPRRMPRTARAAREPAPRPGPAGAAMTEARRAVASRQHPPRVTRRSTISAAPCDSARLFRRPAPSSTRNGRSGSTHEIVPAACRPPAFAVGAADDQPVGGAGHGDVKEPAVFVLGFSQRRARARPRPARRRRPCVPPRSSRRRQA